MYGVPMAKDYPALTAPDLSKVGEEPDAAAPTDTPAKS